MTIGFDAGAVGDIAGTAKAALDEALSDPASITTIDTRISEALDRIHANTQEGKDSSESHLDTGASAARAMETSDAEGANTAASVGGGSGVAPAGATGGGRAQPNVQVTPAALAQMAGLAPPASAPRIAAPQVNPLVAPQMSPMVAPRPSAPSAMNLVAPLAQAAQAATSVVTPVVTDQRVALTPDQQQRLAAALSEYGGSTGSSTGSADLDLGAHSGELFDITRALVAADIPYAWGGGTLEGPSQGISDGGGAADAHGDYNKIGYDCSGLSRYVHYQTTGEEVPRTSQAQFAAGTEVPLADARPGDFVFPNSSFGSGGPGHVQIYLGDGKVLEAPQSGEKVKISEMTPSIIKRM